MDGMIIIFEDGCTLIFTFWFRFIYIVLTLDWITKFPSLCGIQVTFKESYSVRLNSLYFRVLSSTELFFVINIEKFNFVRVSSVLWCHRIPECRTEYSYF